MCVTIHIPVLIAIYMYISDKLFVFVKFSWIKLAKFMIKQYHKCNCSKLIVNSLTNLCESPWRYLCWEWLPWLSPLLFSLGFLVGVTLMSLFLSLLLSIHYYSFQLLMIFILRIKYNNYSSQIQIQCKCK
jgi:hypothetical protein